MEVKRIILKLKFDSITNNWDGKVLKNEYFELDDINNVGDGILEITPSILPEIILNPYFVIGFDINALPVIASVYIDSEKIVISCTNGAGETEFFTPAFDGKIVTIDLI